MKIAFLLGSPAISGGTYVVFEHATRNQKDGMDVYIITENHVNEDDIKWHANAKELKFLTYEEAKNIKFDIAIATWWRTVYELYRINSKKYVYFVQSIESKFYPKNEKSIVWLAEATYMFPLSIITEATWIKDYLEKKYNRNVELVHNGIRKDIYTVDGDSYEKCKGLRVLIEGPVDVPFKNVPKTIELVRKSKADEIWCLTSSDVSNYEGVDRVFSRVPITEVSKIYRSCDLIVKLSYVEGMFGPPLEMFHCGGTAITYDVSGFDEYLVDDYNSFVIKTDNESDVVSKINKLKTDKKLLKRLKKNATLTANEWIDWKESSKRFGIALKKIYDKNSLNQQSLEHQSKFIFDSYVNYETKEIPFKKSIIIFVSKKYPHIYKLYKKLKRLFKKNRGKDLKKIALIVDVKDWAFYNIAKNVSEILKNKYEFKIIPLEELNGNIISGFLECKDCDLIHFFWRGYLGLLDEDFAKQYAESIGTNIEDFKKQFVYNKIITTAIYDHLFISENYDLTKKVIGYSDNYYTSSKKLFDIYSNKKSLKKPTMVITDGVDLKKFFPVNVERFNIDKQSKLVIGWVGNSAWGKDGEDTKGVNTILKPAINELISEGYNIEMNFADKQIEMMPHDEMNEYYSKIDVYICTSTIEGTPNPVLESMACGVPIISTNVGIVPEVFGKNQQDYILNDRTISELKKAVIQIYKNRKILKKLSEENIKRIKKWSWKQKAKNFDKFFRKSLKVNKK